MPDKRKFRIGQPVEVNLNHRVIADYELSKYRRVKRAEDWDIHTETNDLVLAVVTGSKLFQEGEYNAGSPGRGVMGYGGHYEDYDPAYLSFDKTVEVWAVRIGYRNKEIYFFEADLKVIEFEEWTSNIPYFWSGWTDRYREQMSRESKDWPRDDGGKWARDPKSYAHKK
jgi:hypothetical protein